MKQGNEMGLLVIWPRYVPLADEILATISSRFHLLRTQFINWPATGLRQRFYRFYGDRLSTSSIKEKTDGKGRFLLVVFEDESPAQAIETTARGIERVNANFFSQKREFRHRYGTKFGLHASNGQEETERDLMLLLGLTLDEVRAEHGRHGVAMPEIHRHVTGDDHWKDFAEFFHFMNRVEPYVILRNAQEIRDDAEIEDIDFLVNSRSRFALFANAQAQSSGAERANYTLTVGNKSVRIDIRYVGDGYFDGLWQANCLKHRQLDAEGRYVLDPENQYYSLAYHCLIHRHQFPDKYLPYFEHLPPPEIRDRLYHYMLENGYRMVEPHDITLKFNAIHGGAIKLSRARQLRNRKGLSGFLKRAGYRLWRRLLGQRNAD